MPWRVRLSDGLGHAALYLPTSELAIFVWPGHQGFPLLRCCRLNANLQFQLLPRLSKAATPLQTNKQMFQ
jgi:hypothetical protein